PQNAAFYFLNFVSWARALGRKYLYFEFFDEAWKAQQEGPQGSKFGIADEDGILKPDMIKVFQGQTIPDNWTPALAPDTTPPNTPTGLVASGTTSTGTTFS